MAKLSKKISLHQRIGSLIKRLNNGEYISTEDVEQQYEISKRNAERDFTERLPKYLGEALLKEKSTKKWFLEKSKNNMLLNEEEELTLNLLIEQSKNIDSTLYKNTLKIVDKFKDSLHNNTIYTKIDVEDISEIKSDLIKVEKAILNKNIISCIYNNKPRIIKPLKLASFNGYWYLVFKDSDNLIKKFYFKDIKNIDVSKEQFKDTIDDLQKKLDNAINAYFDGNKKEYAVQLYVNKEISHLFKRKKISPSQRIIKNYEDDSIDIELFITNDMEIIPTIQKFIPYIKIIGPISLEKKCMENIENYKQF
ncbi:transcriptional regulator (WYL domain) [Aliarcobacter cibarius]|uniref:Transcriptional regulator (WYL domain) n=1 Tax=Aliarcobacter cibarius TaxID=255507 RepID=A0A7L5JM42_9BACT|nr:WYL domain-containing protein [Aliarcobacter cibarius]QKJ26169.1 transcriptional regulator (WYL domain) [Aliarcobacter cibarius]